MHKLVYDLENGRRTIDDKTVILVDEAGMAGSRTWHALQAQADRAGAKVVFIGDHKQLQAVEAGGVFRNLQDRERGIGAARLDTVMRQRDKEHREAVQKISRGEAAQAMSYYVDRGLASVEKTHKAAVKEATRHYMADRQAVGKDNVVALASTNKVVADLNASIRSELKARGELGEARSYTLESGHKIELATGDRIVMDERYKTKNGNIEKAEVLTVEKHLDRGRVQVRDAKGAQFALDVSSKANFRHGYAMTVHKSQGATYERVTVMANQLRSREMAYVMASRSKEQTRFVVTREAVNKMAREVRGAPPKDMVMRAHMIEDQRMLAGHKQTLTREVLNDYANTREWLRKHDPQHDTHKDLAHVVKAMETSRPKETTLDYEVRERPAPEIEKTHAHEHETQHNQERRHEPEIAR